jgi:hypothetical protein
MTWSTREPRHRLSRHRPRVTHSDRRALERAGWRTLLEYREDHVRDADGMLVGVAPMWVAEAERANVVVAASARHIEQVWAELRRAVREA